MTTEIRMLIAFSLRHWGKGFNALRIDWFVQMGF